MLLGQPRRRGRLSEWVEAAYAIIQIMSVVAGVAVDITEVVAEVVTLAGVPGDPASFPECRDVMLSMLPVNIPVNLIIIAVMSLKIRYSQPVVPEQSVMVRW